jgi:hypothetical protein
MRALVILAGMLLLWGCSDDPQPSCCWESVASGWTISCGLRTSGSVECWGGEYRRESHGVDLDDPRYVDENTLRSNLALESVDGEFTQLSLRWRNRAYGTLVGGGVVEVVTDLGPDRVLPPVDARAQAQVAAEGGCALDAIGSPICWGRLYDAYLSGAYDQADWEWYFYSTLPDEPFRLLRLGTEIGCAQRGDTTWRCWGNQNPKSSVWTEHPTLFDRWEGRAIDQYDQNLCLVDSDGRPRCWSYAADPNSCLSGACAMPEGDEINRWLHHEDGYIDLAVGYDHACFLHESGETDCVGNNHYGQRDAPQEQFAKIFAGHRISCGIREDGALFCWGDASTGGLKIPD